MHSIRNGHAKLIKAIKHAQGDQSLRQFADVLGVGVSTLSMIYSGERSPGRKVLGALLSQYPELREAVTLFLTDDVTIPTENSDNI